MRAAFGISLIAALAQADDHNNCCVSSPFYSCGYCQTYSDSDWCNASEDNCKSCGNWCPPSDPEPEPAPTPAPEDVK